MSRFITCNLLYFVDPFSVVNFGEEEDNLYLPFDYRLPLYHATHSTRVNSSHSSGLSSRSTSGRKVDERRSPAPVCSLCSFTFVLCVHSSLPFPFHSSAVPLFIRARLVSSRRSTRSSYFSERLRRSGEHWVSEWMNEWASEWNELCTVNVFTVQSFECRCGRARNYCSVV